MGTCGGQSVMDGCIIGIKLGSDIISVGLGILFDGIFVSLCRSFIQAIK